MRDKPSEWIAISDLMAGVMAVVMLMLVVAVVQKSTSELRYQEELAKAKAGNSKVDAAAAMMQTLNEKLVASDAAALITLDKGSNRLILRDGVFERGSACLKPEAHTAIDRLQRELANFILDNPKARILVEGYTDNLPVNRPVIDYQRFCTVYDDNFTLSAARAREARRALIGTIDEAAARRVVVAGYGDSRPLPDINPTDPRNRRVEVQFLVDK